MTNDTRGRVEDICDSHRITTKRMRHPTRKGILVNLTACVGCEWTGEFNDDAGHRAHVARLIVDALRPTVRTIEELDGLPYESVVRSDEGCVWEKDPSGWYEPGARQECISSDIALPALVLWCPADEAEVQQ